VLARHPLTSPNLFSSVDSSEEIVTRLQAGRPRNSGSILGTGKIISCPLKTPGLVLGSAHSCIQRVTRALSLRVKRPGPNHSSLPKSMIKNKWSYTSTLPCAFMVCVGTALLTGEFCNPIHSVNRASGYAYKVVSKIHRTGAAICTEVLVARSTGRW
jgi:hypothetical protein